MTSPLLEVQRDGDLLRVRLNDPARANALSPALVADLTELYGRDYLVNPRVNVSLLGYAKRRFTMLGQVNRPGSYEMPEGSPAGIDILEAVAIAGGYTRIAAPERISVRRQHTGASDQILKVNAKRLAKGEGGSFLVTPGDTVTVGESIF